MSTAMKKVVPRRSTMPFWTVTIACSLLVLFSGCSWIRTLEENIRFSFQHTDSLTTALPTVEVPVRMLFPDGTHTVEGAISYLLEPHFYRPAIRNTTGDVIAERTFINNFNNDPVPLHVAIDRLMGRDGQIILDRNRKLYTFRARQPDEASIDFSDLSTTAAAITSNEPVNYTATLQELPGGIVDAHEENISAVTEQVAKNADDYFSEKSNGAGIPAETGEFCFSIHFRNQSMLSASVQDYFLRCGFDEVSWSLGEPGRYADYRLLQGINLPLPGRQRDLIEFLQSRFGIKTLIHDDNRVEFYDEDSSF